MTSIERSGVMRDANYEKHGVRPAAPLNEGKPNF